MPYELYRRSTLGLTLADALDDMIQSEQLTPHLAMRVLTQFDRSMMENLERKIRSRATLKGYLNMYRSCDDVWTFVLSNASIRVDDESIVANKVKIVACNSKRPNIDLSLVSSNTSKRPYKQI